MKSPQRYLNSHFTLLGTAAIALSGCGDASRTRADSAGETAADQGARAQLAPTRVKDGVELDRMRQFAAARVDPSATKMTLKTADNRPIDCVDVYGQPALRRPEMENHRPLLAGELLAAASVAPEAAAPPILEPMFDLDEQLPQDPQQAPVAARRICPEGTVPIPRLLLDELVRFETLEEFFRKPTQFQPIGSTPPGVSIHEHAWEGQVVPGYGGHSILNVWSPGVERWQEFSLSQMWVCGGSGSGLQTVEAGWIKWHSMSVDDKVLLFIYSTRDNYLNVAKPGCWNNSCNDFVQVSRSIFPGQAVLLTSTPGGGQAEFDLKWDGSSSVGWRLYFQGEYVGYYPNSLFNDPGLYYGSNEVDFGGEIVNTMALGTHTTTDMGSGKFPGGGWSYTAKQRQVQYLRHIGTRNGSYVWTDVVPNVSKVEKSNCYNLESHPATGDPNRTYFYFGGPGYDATRCP